MHDRPLRVLHVVPHLHRVGGYERQALLLARHQAGTGAVRPIVLTHAAPGLPEVQHEGELLVHRLPAGLLRHHPGGWWRRHGGEVDVVHAHALHKLSGQVVARAAAAGVPCLVKVATEGDVAMFARPGRWQQPLDGDEAAPRGLRWRRMAAAAFRRLARADLFLATNEAIAAELAAHGLASAPARNAVDTARFRPAGEAGRTASRARLGLPARAVVVASVCRLATRKDVPVIVQAFGRLLAGARAGEAPVPGGGSGAAPAPSRDGPLRGDAAGAVLVLAGEGPARGAVQEAARRAGVASHVRLLGERDDVGGLLAAADVFVHAARREGQPNAVLEALAAGLPCVLSDVAGHRACVAGAAGAALFFPPGDAAALAAALRRLAGDAGLRRALGAAGRRHVERAHALDAVSEAWLALYRERLAATRGARGR